MTDMTALKTSSAAINTNIKKVARAGVAFNNLVQATIEMVILHAKEHGDCTGAARLIDAMPKSNRRALVIDHFAQYSPISVRKSAKTGLMTAKLRNPADDGYHPFDVDGVKANRWDERPEVENEPGILTFADAKEKVHKLLTLLETKADKSSDKSNIIEFVQKVRAGVAQAIAA